MVRIVHQPEADPAALEDLLDRVFGPDRRKKTAYSLRKGIPPLSALSFAAYEGDALVGSISFTAVRLINPDPGMPDRELLLLGPLAVDPGIQAQGFGLELIRRGLERAAELGHQLVILVGDLPYYGRAGFRREGAENLRLPGPVDPARLLIHELVPGAAQGLAGMVEKIETLDELLSPSDDVGRDRKVGQ